MIRIDMMTMNFSRHSFNNAVIDSIRSLFRQACCDKEKVKSKETTRLNLMKIQQGFGGLSVVLCSQMLATLEKLLQHTIPVSDPLEDSSQAGFDVIEAYTHGQRMRRLLDVPITPLLFNIGTICYRKSCNLKRIQKNGDGETVTNQSMRTNENQE